MTAKPKSPKSLLDGDGSDDIFEKVFTLLDSKSLLRCARTNKHMNSLVTSSSRIQLALRKHYHNVTPTFHQSTLPVVDQLAQLVRIEKNLANLTPETIKCAHFPHGEVIDVQDGLMLVSESFRRIPLDGGNVDRGFEVDGWSVWQIREDTMSVPGTQQVQGMRRWRMEFGKKIEGLAMCPQDDLIAIATAPQLSHDSERVIRRVYFRSLRPSKQSATPSNVEAAHPLAALPFSEWIFPVSLSGHDKACMQIVPGDTIGVLLRGIGELSPLLAVWDWQKGVCVGRYAKTCQTRKNVTAFSFLTPDIIVLASLRPFAVPPGEETSVDLKPCLDVYMVPHALGRTPHPILHSDLDTGPLDGALACAWNLEDMIYGIPTVTFCGPSLAIHEDLLLSRFVAEDMMLSASARPSSAHDHRSGILSFSVAGHAQHIRDPGMREQVTCLGSIPIPTIFDRVSKIHHDRTRLAAIASQVGKDQSASPETRLGKDEEAQASCERLMADLWSQKYATDDPIDCINPSCGHHRSNLLECITALEENQPLQVPHFHFQPASWDSWGTSGRFFLQDPYISSTTVGSRQVSVFGVEPRIRGAVPSDGVKLSAAHLHIQDFNHHATGEILPEFDRPIGFYGSPSTTPSSFLPTTRAIPCSLARSIPPPRPISGTITSVNTGVGIESRLKNIFLHDIKTSHQTEYLTISRKLQVSPIRPIKGAFFDGENLVLAMRSGANILEM